MSNPLSLIRAPWVGVLHLVGWVTRRCLLALMAAVCLPLAAAVPICIPQADGVPALSGAPNWLDPSVGVPRYWTLMDDPRWRGATTRSLGGSGATEHVSFRALRDGSALYLSWHVKAAPAMNSAEALNIAFSPGGGAADQLLIITPNNTAGALTSEDTVVPPQMTSNVSAVRGAGGAWVSQAAMPTWVAANTRVSRDMVSKTWSVRMKVPIAAGYNAGINLASGFRIWYEVDVNTLGGLVPYINTPALNLDAINSGTNATGWEEFNRTLTSSDPTICARGVSLLASDVGTKGAQPNRISLTGPNTLFAHPKNETGSTVPAGAICAQFRIANWGSQADWNDISGTTGPLWKLLSAACPAGPTNPGDIFNNAKADTAGTELTQPYTVTAADRCEFTGSAGVPASQAPDGVAIPGNASCSNVLPTRRLHQCMLVEMSGGGLTYTPNSVYRNMDYVKASTFTRDAEINVAGLAGAAQRDVYLFVKTYQMPADINKPQPADGLLNLAEAQKYLRQGDDRPPRTVADGAEPPKTPPVGESFDVLNQVYPTYIVHAYHDTGQTVTRKGTVYKVLRPQSSFGYYVTHEGALTGWDHSLQGAQQIGPDFYRISVNQAKSETVTTRIVAREHDATSGKYAVWGGAGIAIPHNSFGNTNKTGPAIALGFEYALTNTVSIEATLSGSRLDGKGANADVDVTQLGVNGKFYFTSAPLRAFATAGIGAYDFDPGSTRFGGSIGAGVQYQFTTNWALEGRYALHAVVNNSPQTTFSTLLLALRYAF